MVKNVQIGGDAPVAVQSMTKTDTTDVDGTIKQIEEMVAAGCEIVRIAVPDKDAAIALKEIRKRTDAPLVADIHFHYKLALMALEAGIDKLLILETDASARKQAIMKLEGLQKTASAN
jgi:(E)-4-hydroxy-3-methylbut-2-enyl-diphosphate synthase